VSRFASDTEPAALAQRLRRVDADDAGIERRYRRFRAATSTEAAYRLLDLVIAAVALFVTAPVVLCACIAVRLDSSGPAVFRQRRLGLNKRPFVVYKFRTMRAEADPGVHRAYIEQQIHGSESRHVSGRRNLYKLVADDRITRVGRVLRRTSIDELPQLLNVLRGDMSIVGPRPVVPYESEIYPPEYDQRFDVKPGLTGLWQVSGRSQRTYREMVALDIVWVERKSIALYLWIVARTPWVLLSGRSAG
jgi:lipopolysaccharide/colanic/teichoic acid biosynthesis glycosyltransferase